MTKFAKLFTTVGIAVLIGATHAKADAQWFVYCEGVENGQNTAYLTTALYSQYASPKQKSELERAAMQRLSETRGAPAYGCSGVSFMSRASAVEARKRTADVHAIVGNKVVMFNMETPRVLAKAKAPGLKRARISRGRPQRVNTTFARLPE
ncbi:MAG: hypothetical protein AAFV19_20890 [Pseudomonadota bacterium]